MDLSSYAAWASIIGSVQQLPQTIAMLRTLLTSQHGNATAQRFVDELTKLSDAFVVLSELKTFHDETQIFHNSFHKVISLTNGEPEQVNVPHVRQNWRFAKPDFERFFSTVAAFRHISPVLPHEDVAQLQDCIHELDAAMQARNAIQIMEGADRTQARVMAILTKADVTLKQAIEDLCRGVLGVERGLRSDD